MPNANANADADAEFIIVIDDGACDYLALVVTMMIVLVGFDWLRSSIWTNMLSESEPICRLRLNMLNSVQYVEIGSIFPPKKM